MRAVQVIPKRWGNSIAIRIPKEVAEETHVRPNEPMTIFLVEQGRGTAEKLWGAFRGPQIGRSEDEG